MWRYASLLVFSAAACAGEAVCHALPDIERQLAARAQKWNMRLALEEGFSRPPAVQVCQLQSGLPFADHARQRIYLRSLSSVNDEITLAHEYVHLAFSHHPRGRNEVYVEKMARILVELP